MKTLLMYWLFAVSAASCLDASAQTLDIYFIDVEGGQSTLIVTPAGQSFLIDTGYAADGANQSHAGDPRQARDANRILVTARAAGITQIDLLMITHFHNDHDGGVVELSQLLPIRRFVDHGSVLPEADRTVPGSQEFFRAYAAVRAAGSHLQPRPGDRLPLQGVATTVVSSARATLAKPLQGAGGRNPACGDSGRPAQEPYENPRSTGVLMQFGSFRFLDLGDLSGAPLWALACPADLIGPVDAYVIAHHGGADSAEPATFAAFRPRVAVMNNGANKGGALETFLMLHQIPYVGDVWQLHRSNAAGKENFPDAQIANLDETTAHWIKLSAHQDGSFQIINQRTGESKNYPAR